MELQHQRNSSDQLIVDMETDQVGLATRTPMFVLNFTDITYRVSDTSKSFFLSLNKKDTIASRPAGSRQDGIKTLLDGVTSKAREGEIFTILGASGSGSTIYIRLQGSALRGSLVSAPVTQSRRKSTLIDALANRIMRESLGGSITLNQDHLDSRLLKVISAYVQQDDLLYPMLTVKETLTYAAELRLPRSMTKETKKQRVNDLIKDLSLERATNTIIGDEMHRGVSGGERRRVSIGIDIVHNPIILFLDEPTSGLDSTSAFRVVEVLKTIAQRGSIVILSIHQPSYRIVNLLDRLLFLSRGQTIYYGPPRGLPMFCSEFGKPIPDKENPIEYLLDLIRNREATPNGAKDLVDFNETWRQGNIFLSNPPPMPLDQAIVASFTSGKLVSKSGSTSISTASVQKFANLFWNEMVVLTKRAFTNTSRMPEILVVRLGMTLVTGIVLGTVFWKVDDTPKGVNERLGFVALGMSTMFYTCADALPVFIQQRYIFMRKTTHNAYRRSSYVISNAIVDLPVLILLSFCFAVPTFFSIGLDGGTTGFFFYVGIILEGFWAGSGFIVFLSAIFKHIIMGYVVVVTLLSYFLLFCGFFINRGRIPNFWIWFHYLSLVKYPYQAVLQNEFRDPKKCFSIGTQMFDNTPIEMFPQEAKVSVLATISNSLGLNLTSTSCITNGLDELQHYEVTDLSKWNCLWVTVGTGFVFQFLFYVILLIGSKNKRK
ncbi:hypothetical protein LUZ60_007255 [Juncus effusus]|nr:hypothetical protein LUZ60_007255 [Juncus effusus]